jgi:hypothetical protein
MKSRKGVVLSQPSHIARYLAQMINTRAASYLFGLHAPRHRLEEDISKSKLRALLLVGFSAYLEAGVACYVRNGVTYRNNKCDSLAGC